MDKLIDYIIRGINKIGICVRYFIILIGLVSSFVFIGYAFCNKDSGDFISTVLNNGMYLLGLTFIFWLLHLAGVIQEERQKDLINILDKIKERLVKYSEITDVNIRKSNLSSRGGSILTFKTKDIRIGYSTNDSNIENFRIASNDKDILNKLKELFKGNISDEECYSKKYTDRLEITIIPIDSQELYKKSDEKIVNLIEGYVKKIENGLIKTANKKITNKKTVNKKTKK